MDYRPECGRCQTPLQPADNAYICSHECTYCPRCVRGLAFVCPTCSGELVRRPRRTASSSPPKSAPPPPDPRITVRRAGSADVAGIAPLFDAYRVFYRQRSDIDAAVRFLADRLARDESVILVAEEDGLPLGFTQLYPSFTSVSLGGIYVLNDLYVAERGRRRGVGARLLRAALEYGRDAGSHYLELSTAVDNPAQRLYEANGWLTDREYLHYELPLRATPEPS